MVGMRRGGRPARSATALVLALALATSGCGVLGGDDGYLVEASFPSAVALFESSAVQTMGIKIGAVEDITIMGDEVRVLMRINRDVPIPVDVNAAITPLSLIGERNITLMPAFKPGDERAPDGHVIPAERITIPVEVDDVLATFTEVLEGIDPEQLATFVSDTADAFEGRGERFNQILRTSARAVELLSEQDEQIIELVETFHGLSQALNAREGQLARLIDNYATATDLLASERERIRTFLRDLAILMDEGEQFVGALERDLPELLVGLAHLALVLEANLDSVIQLIAALPVVAEGLVSAFNPDVSALMVKAPFEQSLRALLESLVGDIIPVPDLPPPPGLP